MVWQAPVAQLQASTSERSSMNSLCLAFPSLLLLLCALSDGQYPARLTFIQTFYSFIHSFNKHLHKAYSVSAPQPAAGDPVTTSLLEMISECPVMSSVYEAP